MITGTDPDASLGTMNMWKKRPNVGEGNMGLLEGTATGFVRANRQKCSSGASQDIAFVGTETGSWCFPDDGDGKIIASVRLTPSTRFLILKSIYAQS